MAVGFRDGIGAMVNFPVTTWSRLAGLISVIAALTGLITLLAQASRRRRRRLAKALVAVPLALLLALVATVGYLGVRHLQPRSLPALTGPYRVGRTAFDWTDTARTDPLAPEPGQHRELSVWVWYPAPADTSGRPAPYAPGHWARMLQFGILANRLDGVRTHSVADAPVIAGRFPLVVLEPGMGLAAPQFTALAEDLASHGYVVAGVTPTYSANVTVLHGHAVGPTPEGNPQDTDRANGDRLVVVWATDARFVAGRIAHTGGRWSATSTPHVSRTSGTPSAVPRRCRHATTIRAAPARSTWMAPPTARSCARALTAPIMLLGTPGDCLAGPCHPTNAVQTDIATASQALRSASTGPAFRYEIASARHFNFTDYGAYYIPRPLHGLAQLGPIDGHRCLTVVSAYVTAFADHVLRGGPEPQEDHRYPEARAVT